MIVLQILAGAAAFGIVYGALTAFIYSLHRHADGDKTYTWRQAARTAAKVIALLVVGIALWVAFVLLLDFAITGSAS